MATLVGILRAIGIIISPSAPSYFDSIISLDDIGLKSIIDTTPVYYDSIMLLESIWLRSKIDIEKLLNSKIDLEIELNGKITLK